MKKRHSGSKKKKERAEAFAEIFASDIPKVDFARHE